MSSNVHHHRRLPWRADFALLVAVADPGNRRRQPVVLRIVARRGPIARQRITRYDTVGEALFFDTNLSYARRVRPAGAAIYPRPVLRFQTRWSTNCWDPCRAPSRGDSAIASHRR